MNPLATVANFAWWLTMLPAWRAFDCALEDPETAQQVLLKRLLSRSVQTRFGCEHRFAEISTYDQFASHVPIRDYAEMEPWIARIRRGEQNVLTPDPVVRLATTSGTSGAQKLIPYTAELQAEFNCAIGPWMADLFHETPSLMCGSAYWAITPIVVDRAPLESAVPIGFEEDTAYLGGLRSRLVEAAMAVPAEVRNAGSLEECRKLTVQHLLGRTDLRLISVWHPSFLSLLLQDVTADVRRLWPNLRLISCWGDGYAAFSIDELRSRFPGVIIQPKGLIATEAIVSIPFRLRYPLAIRSHFFEFVAGSGEILRAHELRDREQYQVLVTTGGGLWRYRLNDIIEAKGRIGNTPSIAFTGKTGNISDRFGEKLSEPFVAQAISRLRSERSEPWKFAMLAPEGSRYVLFVDGAIDADLAPRLDAMLQENPQYAYCRELGQLDAPLVIRVQDGYNALVSRLNRMGIRGGDIKPAALSTMDGWTNHFTKHACKEFVESRRN